MPEERYPFTGSSRDSAERWNPIINEQGSMDMHMQRLYDAISHALDEGVFYSDEMRQVMSEKLGTYFDYPDDPGIDRIEGGIRGMEIYYARKAVEEHRRRADNRAAAKMLALGHVFKNVTIGGKRYSSARVDSMDKKTGQVHLFMTKRGSRQRWTQDIGAAKLPIPGFTPAYPEHGGVTVNVNVVTA